MNSPKVVVSLGLAIIFSVILAACGGSKYTPPPPGPPIIQTDSLPHGAVNASYGINGLGAILSAAGGTGAYTWSISTGPLPPGLSLNASQGVILGTPTTVGNYPITVQVTDANSLSSTANLSIYIEGVVSITPASLPSGSVGVPYSQTLAATGGLQPYTWCVLATVGGCDPTQASLPPGLSLNTTTGVISGTPTTPAAPASFMIQVTDAETSPGIPAVGSSSFSIAIMSITTTSLMQGSAGVPYSATLTASGGVPFKGGQYSWCIASGLPDGLTLDNNCTNQPGKGLISGTPTKIGTFGPFTVQASDKENPPATATASLSITIAAAVTNANLSGNYVFTFSGYNNGTLVLMAGSFFADGQGNITYGELDYNNGNGEPGGSNPTPQIIAANSTYSINPNGLGTMTLVTNMSPPSPYVFNVSITSDGSGRLIQSDPTQPQTYGSGTIMKHTPLAKDQQWPLCGSNVAVGLFGVDSSSARYAAAGQFQFNPSTCVDFVSGVPGMDINDGGSPSSATFSGAFNQYDNVNSRGYVGITFKPGGAHTYAFYLVSSNNYKQNELILVSTDPTSQSTPLTLWSGLPQPNLPTGWDNSRLTGTDVAELNALDNNVTADVTAGLFVGQGVTGHTCTSGQGGTPQFDPATLNYDENQGGTSSLQQTSTGTYCIDKTTGRVTLTPFNVGPFAVPPVFYMITANQAFVVGTDVAVASGILEQQTGSPFSTLSIFGLYSGGTVTPVLPTVTNAVTSLYADGTLNINGMQDTSGPGGPVGPPPVGFSYTYTVDNTGRAVVLQNGAPVAIMYVVGSAGSQTSPTKAVMMPVTDPNPALSVFNATVIP